MTRLQLSALCAAMLTLASTARAQPDECAVYQAALSYLGVDPARPMVIYDSTSMAMPSMALRAHVRLGGGATTDTGFIYTAEISMALSGMHHDRRPLPACVGNGRNVIRVPYDSIGRHFADRSTGWEQFRAAFPGATSFYLISDVHYLGSDSAEAVLYIARASAWLSGEGRILRLRRGKSGWSVTGDRRVWVS